MSTQYVIMRGYVRWRHSYDALTCTSASVSSCLRRLNCTHKKAWSMVALLDDNNGSSLFVAIREWCMLIYFTVGRPANSILHSAESSTCREQGSGEQWVRIFDECEAKRQAAFTFDGPCIRAILFYTCNVVFGKNETAANRCSRASHLSTFYRYLCVAFLSMGRNACFNAVKSLVIWAPNMVFLCMVERVIAILFPTNEY